MNDSSHPNLPEEQLPHEVVAALRDRYGPENRVPEALDNVILSDAADHLRTISPPTPLPPSRRQKTWIAVSTGSLAAAMLLFVMWPDGIPQSQPVPERMAAAETADVGEADVEHAAFASKDIDQNGAVDILDAFALARTVQTESSNLSRWDQNGDGQTDQDDINLIAMTAVTL